MLKSEIVFFLKKEWVTVPEAVTFLSNYSLIEFSETDIYKYALSKDLLLSILLPDRTPVEIGEFLVTSENPDIIKIKNKINELKSNNQTLSKTDLLAETVLNYFEKTESCQFHSTDENKIKLIDGLWDLPMKGGEYVCVEQLLNQSMGLEFEDTIMLDGVFTSRDQTICKFLDDFEDERWSTKKESEKPKYYDPARYFPAGGFPKNFKIVLRTLELIRFIKENGIDKNIESTSTPHSANDLRTRKRLDPVGEIMDELFRETPNISSNDMWQKIKTMSDNNQMPFLKTGMIDAVTYYAGTQSQESKKDLTRKSFNDRFSRFKAR